MPTAGQIWRTVALPIVAWAVEVFLSGFDSTNRLGLELSEWVVAILPVPAAVGLVWRHAQPWSAFLIALVQSIILGLFIPTFASFLILLVALYALARRRPVREIGLAAALTLIPWTINTFVNGAGGAQWDARPVSTQAVGFVVYVAGTIGAISLARNQTRAEDLSAMRLRTVEALIAVRAQDERLSEARELTSRLASSVAAVNSEIEGTRSTGYWLPVETSRSLSRTEQAVREALSQIGAIGRVLEPSPVLEDDAAVTVPLEELLGELQRNGWGQTEVDVTHIGTAVELSPEVEECASRCLTAAIANAVKHAAPRVRVQLDWRTDPVVVEVVNTVAVRIDQIDPVVSGGVGLGAIIHRVTGLGGEVFLQSSPETFTLVLHLPRGPADSRRT